MRHSFDLKLDRAERHIAEVEDEVRAYVESDPISLRTVDTHTVALDFADVPAHLPIVVADVVHNLRSALDHLAAALVPKKHRRDTMFPIFFAGVWEPGPDNENKERKKARERWDTTTRHMAPEAIEILKQIQAEDRDDWPARGVPPLDRLNRFANRDKHAGLIVVGGGATDLAVVGHDSDGNRFPTRVRDWTEPHAVMQGAAITLPPETTGAEISGNPQVLLMFGDEGGVPIPDALRDPLLSGCRRVADALRPFVM